MLFLSFLKLCKPIPLNLRVKQIHGPGVLGHHIKYPKSSSKVGFGENLNVGQKVGPEVGFSFLPLQENPLPDLTFDLLWDFPRNLSLSYFRPTDFGDCGSCGSRGPSLMEIAAVATGEQTRFKFRYGLRKAGLCCCKSEVLEKESFFCQKLLVLNQKRPFVHNCVCSPFWENLFAIVAKCSQLCLTFFFSHKFKRKSIIFLVGRGGGIVRTNMRFLTSKFQWSSKTCTMSITPLHTASKSLLSVDTQRPLSASSAKWPI